ncbi:MAG: hypothetical protein QM831_18490 [Kofleriaceae bacterium]
MQRLQLILCLLVACGDKDHGTSPYVAMEDVATAFQTARCTHLVACHEAVDVESCVTQNVGAFPLGFGLIDEANHGSMIYNGNTVAKCFAAIANESCDPSDETARQVDFVCAGPFFIGAVTAGKACNANIECRSGICSDCVGSSSTACCSGTCVDGPAPPTSYLPGQACDTLHPCALGTHCDLTVNTCQPLVGSGQHCSQTSDCAYGLQCDFESSTCNAAPLRDQPCSASGRCGEEGTYCHAGEDICRSVKLLGEACDSQNPCASPLYTCASTGKCALLPPNGTGCFGSCGEFQSYCDSASMCEPARENGEPCDGDGIECISQSCDPSTLRCVDQPSCHVIDEP